MIKLISILFVLILTLPITCSVKIENGNPITTVRKIIVRSASSTNCYIILKGNFGRVEGGTNIKVDSRLPKSDKINCLFFTIKGNTNINILEW